MSKLHENDENPIDHILLRGCTKLLPVFKQMNFTPNGITSLSNIFSLLGIYSFWQNSPLEFYIFIWMGYFFDCMDGHYARTYKMTSAFGDYYDHISDIVLILLFAYVFYTKYGYLFSLKSNKSLLFMIASVIVLLLMGKHIACQERIHEERLREEQIRSNNQTPTKLLEEQSHSLSILKWFCDDPSQVWWTKYFGIGSGFLFFYTAALYFMLNYNSQ